MAELIRRHGGEPIVAPSMREVPLAENSAPLELCQKIGARRIDLVVAARQESARERWSMRLPFTIRENESRTLLDSVTLLAGDRNRWRR